MLFTHCVTFICISNTTTTFFLSHIVKAFIKLLILDQIKRGGRVPTTSSQLFFWVFTLSRLSDVIRAQQFELWFFFFVWVFERRSFFTSNVQSAKLKQHFHIMNTPPPNSDSCNDLVDLNNKQSFLTEWLALHKYDKTGNSSETQNKDKFYLQVEK